MTITEAREKCKKALARVPQDVLLVIILVLACLASFGLGYQAGRDAGLSVGETGQGSEVALEPYPVSVPTTGQVVASKGGTKYYLSSCAAADRISDANKIFFQSADAARTQGYTPAANCPGL